MVREQWTEKARERLERVFREGRLNGVMLDAERGHSMKWGEPLNPAWFGIPPHENPKFVVAPATVPVDQFIELQKSARQSPHLFERHASSKTMARAAESIELGSGDVPTPVVEIGLDGSIKQEGRSRALGARKAGARSMPVWLAARVYR